MRVAGLANGLCAHGINATIVVPDGRVREVRANSSACGLIPVPAGSVVISAKNFAAFLDCERPNATIITNSNYYQYIAGAKTGHLIFDFFAPKLLEALCGGASETEMRELDARKRTALAASDGVIVNGARKLDYVAEFMRTSGRAGWEDRIAVVNMCYDWPQRPSARRPQKGDAGLSVIVSGYTQRWLDYGNQFEQLAEALYRLSGLTLTLMMPSRSAEPIEITPALKSCLSHPRVSVRSSMLFEDFAKVVQAHDVFLDIFEPNEERKLAMVTRSVTALGLGVPAIHPTFTELAPLIDKANAGWLLNLEPKGGLYTLLETLSVTPTDVAAKAAGAARLAQGALAPQIAVKPLVEMLRGF